MGDIVTPGRWECTFGPETATTVTKDDLPVCASHEHDLAEGRLAADLAAVGHRVRRGADS